MTLSYGSVCSGIEAASVAWHPLGFIPAFFSEIEKFPSAVLAHHYGSNMPGETQAQNGIPNYGDMTKFKEWPAHGKNSSKPIDILVGGTPCQSFSIAGLRAGLADPRGNLMLTYLAIVARYSPKWVVWENVPGVLSSNGGRDFGTFLGALGKLGYGFAYRVLDAQHCRTHGFPNAVPQRRRRVFVVGCLGDWRRAAAVLFDQTSLRGDSAPSRKTGEKVAGTITSRASGGGGGPEQCDGATEGFLQAVKGRVIASHYVACTLTAREYKGPLPEADLSSVIAHCAPVAPTVSQGPPYSRTGNERVECEDIVAFDCKGTEVQNQSDGVTAPLRSMGHHKSHSNAGGHSAVAIPINSQIAMRDKAMGKSTGLGIGKPGDPSFTLQSSHHHAVAYAIDDGREIEKHQNGLGISDEGNSYTLNSSGDQPAVAYNMRGREGGSQLEGPHHTANIRAGDGGSSRSYVAEQWAVRRLTPTECERLQGFPDGYTAIPWRNKPPESCPDGPRYKALGNSMAVNVMRVLGERIAMVDKLEAAI